MKNDNSIIEPFFVKTALGHHYHFIDSAANNQFLCPTDQKFCKMKLMNELIQDQIMLFQQVSMLFRIKFLMPSPTNSLESIYGHLNHRTPRRNYFYSPILRIITELNSKYTNLNQRINHSFGYLKNRTQDRLDISTKFHINIMCEHHHTTICSCLCGENKLESPNYSVDKLCSHRLSKGSTIPQCQKIKFCTRKFLY